MLSLSLLGGCGSKEIKADTSAFSTDITNLAVPQTTQIVGLGEASHGASEYHQMKAEVFKALVANNGSRTFIIEGDFGGSLKVEDYIHGGEGTAEEAVSQIGFAIYRTKELADLVQWMRDYNESAPEGQDLHFYGMDMQRYDNNKEYLFKVLDAGAPDLSEQYKKAFSSLTDDNRLTLDSAALKQSKEEALNLLHAMDAKEQEITEATSKEAFGFARECVGSIYQCSELSDSGKDYNTLRDKYMAEKVNWFVNHGDDSMLYINGHNGHIGKTSTSGYNSLGKRLAKQYGDDYFAIGTEAAKTSFNSQTDDGFTVRNVNNKNSMTFQLNSLDSDFYYLDFADVADNEDWQKILTSPQKMTALNVGIASWQEKIPMFYTQSIVPAKNYNGMLIFKQVTPSTLFN